MYLFVPLDEGKSSIAGEVAVDVEATCPVGEGEGEETEEDAVGKEFATGLGVGVSTSKLTLL